MKIKIALAQVAVNEDHEANIINGLRLLAEAAGQGARVICYPEMSFCRFFPQYHADPKYFEWAEPVPGPLVERFQDACRSRGITAVFNMYEKGEPGQYFDCSPVISSKGEFLGKSQMMHIAELPNYNEKYYYWEGRTWYPVFEDSATGLKFGIAICYDRHFPEQMRILAIKGAQLIFVPTATSLTELSTIWEVEMQAASAANQVFIAVANHAGEDDKIHYFGKSFVTDPCGEVLAMAGGTDEELLIVEIDPEEIEKTRRKLPFLRDRRPDTYGGLIEP